MSISLSYLLCSDNKEYMHNRKAKHRVDRTRVLNPLDYRFLYNHRYPSWAHEEPSGDWPYYF